MAESGSSSPGLAKSSLIRELVDLSRFTEGILRTMASAVVAVDPEGRVAYVNPAAEILLDRPASDLLRRPAGEVLVTRNGDGLVTDAEHQEESFGEVDLKLHDGRLVTVDARLTRHLGPEGQSEGVVLLLTDRTDLKRAEQEARRKERLASLGELSAGVAHEIRNPLAGIAAGAQLLRSRLEEGDERIRLADMIEEEVARLNRIVESLLLFARPPEPRLREERMEPWVQRAVDLVREQAESSGVKIETAFSPGLPSLWIDPDQVVQVALNLVRNAVQAMEKSGGTLQVGLRRVRRRRYVRNRAGRRREERGRLVSGRAPLLDWVELEVTDTGPGLSPEAQERMFNPFYTTRPSGTGLGLAVTQSIVQEHGGMITVTSEPGKGTTVLVDFPLEKRRGPRRNPVSAR